MNTSIAKPIPESWLRRAWRAFYGFLQAMESSGYEVMDDRMNDLDRRVRRLEAQLAAPKQD